MFLYKEFLVPFREKFVLQPYTNLLLHKSDRTEPGATDTAPGRSHYSPPSSMGDTIVIVHDNLLCIMQSFFVGASFEGTQSL